MLGVVLWMNGRISFCRIFIWIWYNCGYFLLVGCVKVEICITDILILEQFAAKTSVPLEFYPFLQEFGRVSDSFVHTLIFSKENTLPSWSKILRRCASLLTNSVSILQLWGYKMLRVLVPGLIEIDLQSDSSSTPNIKGFTIGQFKEILVQTHNIVDGVLAGFKLGEDSCQVTPFTDSYTYVFAYLCLWGVLLEMCEKSPPELRYQYAEWFRFVNLNKKNIYFI